MKRTSMIRILTGDHIDFWERLHNPDFKPLEFEGFRKLAGMSLN